MAISLAVFNTGCGGVTSAGAAGNTSISVSINPNSATVGPGGSQQLSATVTGASDTSVKWSTTGGSISASGLYTAPAAAGTYTVTATSVADNTKAASASITVSTTPPPIAVSLNPTSAALQTGTTRQFTATVTGTGNAAVTWSATGGTVSSGGLYTAPGTAGTYTVKATSVADNTKSATATVTVSVTTPVAQIAISPTSLVFGSVVANTSSTQTVTISNTGGVSFSVSAANVSGSNAFAVTGATFPITVAAGKSANLTIRFAPTSTGSFSGTLTVVSNAPNTPAAVSLSGSASATPTFLLSVSPTSLSFGSVLVGSSSTQNVSLSNTGNSSITVTSANFTGSRFSSNVALPFTIAAGASRTVAITFAPDTSGPFSGSVSFVSNATNSPATVSLSSTATSPVPHSVDLAWVGSSSSGVVGYYVYRGTVNGGPYSRLNSTPATSTNYSDSTVQSGATYYYVVTAVDGNGMESSYSNQSTAVIPTP